MIAGGTIQEAITYFWLSPEDLETITDINLVL